MHNRIGLVFGDKAANSGFVEQVHIGRHQRAGMHLAGKFLRGGDSSVVADIQRDDGAATTEQNLGAAPADLPEGAGDQNGIDGHR